MEGIKNPSGTSQKKKKPIRHFSFEVA